MSVTTTAPPAIAFALRTGDAAWIVRTMAPSMRPAGCSSWCPPPRSRCTAGRWGFVPSDLSSYGHGSVKADIAAAKAAGYCART